MENTKPDCRMINADGNVFSIIGLVSSTLERAGMRDRAKEFRLASMKQPDYDAVLTLCMEYVNPVGPDDDTCQKCCAEGEDCCCDDDEDDDICPECLCCYEDCLCDEDEERTTCENCGRSYNDCRCFT